MAILCWAAKNSLRGTVLIKSTKKESITRFFFLVFQRFFPLGHDFESSSQICNLLRIPCIESTELNSVVKLILRDINSIWRNWRFQNGRLHMFCVGKGHPYWSAHFQHNLCVTSLASWKITWFWMILDCRQRSFDIVPLRLRRPIKAPSTSPRKNRYIRMHIMS
jgi:hypothetical protein